MRIFLAWKNGVQVTWAKLFHLCGLVEYTAWVEAQPFGNLWRLDTQCLSHSTAWHPHDWCFPKSVLQTWFKDNYCKYFCTSIACFDSWRVNDSVLLIWLQLNWQTFLRSHLHSMAIHFELLRGYHEHGKIPQMDCSCRSNECRLNRPWARLSFQMATEHHACVILVLHVYKLVSVTHIWQGKSLLSFQGLFLR